MVPDPPEEPAEAVTDVAVAGIVQVAAAEALADEPVGCVPPAEVALLEPWPAGRPGADDVLSVVCVALPRAPPPPPPCGTLPPLSTVELAWMSTWRNG